MHHFDFLDDIVLLCAAAVAVILVFQRFRIPPIIGLITTGILLGPSGAGLITQDEVISTLSELGVILLLFTIGLEFSLDDLRKLRRIVLIGGPLQIALSTLAIGVGAYVVSSWISPGTTWQTSAMIGLAMALSSTAICTKLLKDRREINLPHGRAVLGILIFQDIAVVPMMIIVSLLAPGATSEPSEIALKIGTMIGIGGGLTLAMRLLLPRLVPFVTRVSAPEVLILGGLAICFGAAWLTSLAGISMALGAFIAGVAIAGSEEGHTIGRVLEPIRDAFTSVFFVSVGLLLHITWEYLPMNIASALGILVVNAIIVALILIALKIPLRVALIAAIILAEVGEFSFVLATAGRDYGLIDELGFQNMLVSIIITMIVTPTLITFAPRIAEKASPAFNFVPLVRWLGKRGAEDAHVDADVGHEEDAEVPVVCIIGAGVLGTNVARVLDATEIPYRMLELNREAVVRLRAEGFPVVHGDSTNRHDLDHVGIARARAVVLAISDQTALAQSVRALRAARPDILVIARTRYALAADSVAHAGADIVVTEEYESSIQVFINLLEHLDVAPDVIQQQEDIMRSDHYGLLGRLTKHI
ncbi:MAG: cation:proton antiporter [Candidatus Kapabacteria bacterium]|jgi:CPA2 family monovalent cation:H+ antiporter-2|nr:cation:proton antiporter [Candidatus Kapabacteria bacterium]